MKKKDNAIKNIQDVIDKNKDTVPEIFSEEDKKKMADKIYNKLIENK